MLRLTGVDSACPTINGTLCSPIVRAPELINPQLAERPHIRALADKKKAPASRQTGVRFEDP